MSKYSAIDPWDGQYHDIIWRKHPLWKQDLISHKGWWVVYLGERMLGYVVPPIKRGWGWDAISHVPTLELNGFRHVRGFASRFHATVYLLWAAGVYFQEPDQDELMLLHMDIVEGIGPEDLELVKAVNKALYGRENVHHSEYVKSINAIKAMRSFNTHSDIVTGF